MGGLFKTPKAPGPTPAQQQALADQSAAVKREEERLAAEDEAQKAARRARTGRNAGRALLLDDELGVPNAGAAPLTKTLGS